MNHFAKAFADLERESGISARQIAIRIGVSESVFSQLKSSGKRVSFDVCRDLGRRFPEFASKLLHARLLDECNGPGAENIEIGIRGEGGAYVMADDVPAYVVGGLRLPPGLAEWVPRIAAAWASDSGLRRIIEWIGERLPEVSSGSKADSQRKDSQDTARLNKYTAETVPRPKGKKGGQR